MPMPIGSKRHGEPLMLGGGGNKRINIEEYTDLDNAICSNNQLTAYSGKNSCSGSIIIIKNNGFSPPKNYSQGKSLTGLKLEKLNLGSSQNGNQMLNQSSNQYFDLQLTAEEESTAPVVNKIQRSLSRQQSTLRSVYFS